MGINTHRPDMNCRTNHFLFLGSVNFLYLLRSGCTFPSCSCVCAEPSCDTFLSCKLHFFFRLNVFCDSAHCLHAFLKTLGFDLSSSGLYGGKAASALHSVSDAWFHFNPYFINGVSYVPLTHERISCILTFLGGWLCFLAATKFRFSSNFVLFMVSSSGTSAKTCKPGWLPSLNCAGCTLPSPYEASDDEKNG